MKCALVYNINGLRFVKKFIIWLLILFFGSTLSIVVIYRFLPVYITPLMVKRCVESGKIGWHHNWVSLDKMSKSAPVAVMASEDQRFLLHNGFDVDAIKKAVERNQKAGNNRYGASTISQQTAKNVFLWNGRSWLRKGLEAYFTVLIEAIWGKYRIMEVYLNSIEMGEGIYGIEAVARQHFGITADGLSRSECALIAATLPNPIRFDSSQPSAYILKRQRQIMTQMKFIPSFPKKGEKYNPKTVVGGVYSK